jgi:hypothetical protein
MRTTHALSGLGSCRFGVPPARRLAIQVIVAFALIVPGLLLSAAGVSAQGSRGEALDLSAKDLDVLRSVSAENGCAVLGLLYLQGKGAPIADGMLYVDRVPSVEEIHSALDASGAARASIVAGMLRTNPYSGLQGRVRIQWWLRPGTADANILAVHALLAGPSGILLSEGRLLEPPALLTISTRGVSLVRPVATRSLERIATGPSARTAHSRYPTAAGAAPR